MKKKVTAEEAAAIHARNRERADNYCSRVDRKYNRVEFIHRQPFRDTCAVSSLGERDRNYAFRFRGQSFNLSVWFASQAGRIILTDITFPGRETLMIRRWECPIEDIPGRSLMKQEMHALVYRCLRDLQAVIDTAVALKHL